MLLDTIIEMWKTDSTIDQLNLDTTTVTGAVLHSKYLELFSVAKLQLKRKEADLAILKKDKWMYYNGKMTRDEMDKKGWPYDPFAGMVKPMKSDLEMYYSADADLCKLRTQIEYQKTIVEALDEIMGTLRWRHQAIKNIIEFKKFTAGC
jgi:hypothetical protein